MHTKIRLILTLVCSAAVAASCSRTAPDWSSNDAAVYAAAFNAMYSVGDSRGDHSIVLVDSTDVYPQEHINDNDGLLGELLRTRRDAVENMQQRSSTKHSLQPLADSLRSHLALQLRIAGTHDFARVQELGDSIARANAGSAPAPRFDKFWHGFYAKYPGSVGSVSVSAIGYSRDGNFAIIYVEHGCGDLCGEGVFVLLHKDAGVWHFGRKIQTFVS